MNLLFYLKRVLNSRSLCRLFRIKGSYVRTYPVQSHGVIDYYFSLKRALHDRFIFLSVIVLEAVYFLCPFAHVQNLDADQLSIQLVIV